MELQEIEVAELQRKIKDGDRSSLIKLLIDPKYKPNMILNDKNETMLHMACRNGHLDIVRTLIEVYNCDLKVIDVFGNSPFHIACAYKHLKVVAYFCRFLYTIPCAHVNFVGDTVLHVASKTGYLPMVRLIIERLFIRKMFEPFKLNMYEDSVFFHLLDANDLKKLQPLVDITMLYNDSGYNPLHVACVNGHLNIIKFFFTELKKCLIMNNLIPCLPSLLRLACENGHHNIIDYLHSESSDGICTILAMVAMNPQDINQTINFTAKLQKK